MYSKWKDNKMIHKKHKIIYVIGLIGVNLKFLLEIYFDLKRSSSLHKIGYIDNNINLTTDHERLLCCI